MNEPNPFSLFLTAPTARSGCALACLLAVTACEVLGPGEIEEPTLVAVIDSGELALAPPDTGDSVVDAAVFLGVGTREPDGDWRTRAAAGVRTAVEFVNGEVFAQCGLHVRLERAGVVALPRRLLSIQGNERGSWGGHPPPGVEDSLAFVYDENERLTAETRELFTFGKRHTSRNTIAAFTVDHITYYVGDEETLASGLSFPPVVYHYSGDYPLRNSVLVVEWSRPANGVPDEVSGRVLAHELAHMLLDSPLHGGGAGNLMASGGGLELDAEQCARMQENNDGLFGETAVADPGRPGGS